MARNRILHPSLITLQNRRVKPLERTILKRIERRNILRGTKIRTECNALIEALQDELRIIREKGHSQKLSQLLKKIQSWEQKADGYTKAEMTLVNEFGEQTLAYQRVHNFRNELYVISGLMQIAEFNGLLEKGFTAKALNKKKRSL